MSMFQQVPLRSCLWFISLSVLTMGMIACGGGNNDDDDDSDNDWVGTWSLETFDNQGLEQVLEQELAPEGVTISILTNNWRFNNDGTLEAEIGFRLENQGNASGISLTSSIKTTGTYFLSGSNYTLTLEEIPIASLKESTGAWSREGNILTLNSDDGNSIAFKNQ